nr:AMP-binding protein [Nocardioides daphniae]
MGDAVLEHVAVAAVQLDASVHHVDVLLRAPKLRRRGRSSQVTACVLICAQPDIDRRDLKLRIISWGAAPASDATLRAMAEKFPDALNVAVFGQTETSPITCGLRGEDSLRKLGSVGQPIPTIQYRLVDPLMNDVVPGEVGEIVYRGPTVMKGYWNKPEATAEAFAGGWFHSGDLVRQDAEGFVWVVDRMKDMIVSGGENIYCAEVENAIANHPAVREVAVIGRADDRWGPGARRRRLDGPRPGAHPGRAHRVPAGPAGVVQDPEGPRRPAGAAPQRRRQDRQGHPAHAGRRPGAPGLMPGSRGRRRRPARSVHQPELAGHRLAHLHLPHLAVTVIGNSSTTST